MRRLAAPTLAIVLIASACGAGESARRGVVQTSRSQLEVVTGHGLRIGVPNGWSGRIYVNETGLRVVQAANFHVARRVDDHGSEAIRKMESDGIFMAVWYWPAWPPAGENGALAEATLPLAIARSDFGRFNSLGAPETAMRVATLDGHLVQVVVSFGSSSVSDETLAAANRVLATFASS